MYKFYKVLFVILLVSNNMSKPKEFSHLKTVDYVTIVVIVPETHADTVRKAMGDAGAGKTEHYSHGSFSVKGMSRFKPEEGSHPYIGTTNQLETVIEERIETVCALDKLENVLTAIKQAHPYEETFIDIFPIYKIGWKKP